MMQLSPKSRLRLSLTILALMLPTACATAPSSACGTLIKYPQDFLDKAAIERDYLRGTGVAPNTLVMIQDYVTTRDTIRACK
jgi:hypothetical protein